KRHKFPSEHGILHALMPRKRRGRGLALTGLRRGHNVRTTMAELPDIIPIFPLPNFVLFPGVTVPLHIFEPRYREMVADVAETHATVGMIMLKGDWERDYYAYPDIFTIGCAGRITSLEKLPDGRYNLQLEGISEFQVGREIRSHTYRAACGPRDTLGPRPAGRCANGFRARPGIR